MRQALPHHPTEHRNAATCILGAVPTMNALPDKPLKPQAALRLSRWYPTNSLAAPRLEFHVIAWKRWHNRDSP